jgi:hypothetical protein
MGGCLQHPDSHKHCPWIVSTLGGRAVLFGSRAQRFVALQHRGPTGLSGPQHEPVVVVGCFFDKSSERNPFHWPVNTPYDLRQFLAGMPDHLRADLLPRVLEYFESRYNGVPRILITAALWCNGARLDAAEPWSAVLANSDDLIPVVLPGL